MPGAHSDRRTFDLVFHGHKGDALIELTQLDAKDVPAFEAYMVRRVQAH